MRKLDAYSSSGTFAVQAHAKEIFEKTEQPNARTGHPAADYLRTVKRVLLIMH